VPVHEDIAAGRMEKKQRNSAPTRLQQHDGRSAIGIHRALVILAPLFFFYKLGKPRHRRILEEIQKVECHSREGFPEVRLDLDRKQGMSAQIKKIGMDARRAIETFMGYKVYLELFVKVDRKWRENPKSLKRLGFS